MTKEQLENLQEMADKLKDYIVSISKDNEELDFNLLAMSTQFLLYSIKKDQSNRYVETELDEITDKMKTITDMLTVSIVGVKMDEK